MYRYVLKRMFMLIAVLLGVLLIVFILNEITPGDPARMLAGEDASFEDVEKLREEMGLNRPFLTRFGDYVFRLVTKGDLGTSYFTGQPVGKEVMARFPTTFLLTLVSMIFTLGIGIPAGIISATRQYTFVDYLCTTLGLVGVSMPNFWQGLINILVFSITFKLLPASGFYGPKYWILPALTIGTSSAAQIMRMTRSSMLDVIRQDYIRSAYGKGLTERKVIYKHALKNALIPILTVIGMDFGLSLGGAVLTESVFGIPGLGKYMLEAIKSRDYPVVQGGVLVFAFAFSIVTLIVDILYAYIDPRIKSMYKTSRKDKAAAPAAQGV